jgi:hypothetical protein
LVVEEEWEIGGGVFFIVHYILGIGGWGYSFLLSVSLKSKQEPKT